MLLELADPVLDVLLVASADELQFGDRAFAGRDDDESSDFLVFVVFLFVEVQTQLKVQWRQGQERLFGHRAEPVLHGLVPAAAVGEFGHELVEFRQGVDVKLRLEPHSLRGLVSSR